MGEPTIAELEAEIKRLRQELGQEIRDSSLRSVVRQTHTYATLEISQSTFDEIKAKLEAAGYQDQFHKDGDTLLVDMHGIAVHAPRKAKPVRLDANGSAVSPEMLREIHKRAQDTYGVEDPIATGLVLAHEPLATYEIPGVRRRPAIHTDTNATGARRRRRTVAVDAQADDFQPTCPAEHLLRRAAIRTRADTVER